MAEELKKTIDEIQKVFCEFKETNEKRLEAIERGEGIAEYKAKLDALETKLQELENAKGELEAKMARSEKPEDKQVLADKEHKEAFAAYLRKGDERKFSRMSEETKAMNTIVGEDGGFAVPRQMADGILKLSGELNPMRSVVATMSVSTEDYSQLVDTGSATSGWVGETTPRDETTAGELKVIKPIFGEIYAFPFVTQRALDDIYFDVETYITGKIADEFAVKENAAFTSGDGTLKPKGLFAYDFVAAGDNSREYGKFQYLKTGAASTLGSVPCDNLISLQDALRPAYQGNARWMMNAATLTAIRQLKDSQGNYLWNPGIGDGTPNVILGKPYVLNHDMPTVAANALAIAYGDFKRAYTIVDRIGVRLTRDSLTKKPYVGFYVTKRVGGMALDTQAVKALKVAA